MQVALLIATALTAATDWWTRLAHRPRIESWTKPATTLLVIGVALASGAPTGQVVIAIVALTLCLLGDVLLLPTVDKFVLGLVAFLLGHLVFIALFMQYHFDTVWLGGVALILACVLISFPGNVIVRGAAVHDPKLRTPVTAYLFVICAMTTFGWATGRPWVIVGTTLFVISDSILGWRQFVSKRPWMAVAIMVTYHGAIASLAISLW